MLARRPFLRQLTAASALAALAPYTTAQTPSAQPKIRIGMIGTGHAHAAGKLEAIRASAEFELVGVVEPDAQRRAAAEQQKAYAGVRWLTEEELLNTPGLQAVDVETEVRELVPTAHRCVAAGMHLHLDKPAGESLPAYRALRELAREKRVTIQMGYMLRYNPAMQLCYRLVREGWLGEVFSVEAAMSKRLSPGERARLVPYRGGSMFELGCHVIDSAVYLLGRPARVTGFNRTTAPAGDGYVDNQTAILEYPQALATMRSSMAEVEGGARRHFTVCGTEGTLQILPLEPGKVRLALQRARVPYKASYQEVAVPKAAGRYDGEFADLAQVIRGEKPFAFSPEHDLAVHETVLLASGLPLA